MKFVVLRLEDLSQLVYKPNGDVRFLVTVNFDFKLPLVLYLLAEDGIQPRLDVVSIHGSQLTDTVMCFQPTVFPSGAN
jgi:hypothetical protein